jgi:hypothetical protein
MTAVGRAGRIIGVLMLAQMAAGFLRTASSIWCPRLR